MTEIIVLPAASISADMAAIQSELAEVRKLLETMLSAPKQSPWMTAREVCEYRRFSETTLRAKVKAGEITKHITPDGVRYRRDEVEAVKRIV